MPRGPALWLIGLAGMLTATAQFVLVKAYAGADAATAAHAAEKEPETPQGSGRTDIIILKKQADADGTG